MQVINFQHYCLTANEDMTQMARVILPIRCPTDPNMLLTFSQGSSSVIVPCCIHAVALSVKLTL